MIEFGKTLIAAREAKGLTIRQLAELTRMAPTTIQELEAENFSRIAAPIYGRGFVKLYCEAVGLEPKPFVTAFMEIYSGSRDPVIKERIDAPAAAPSTPAPEQPVTTEPPPVPEAVLHPSAGKVESERTDDLFHQNPPEPVPAPERVSPPEQVPEPSPANASATSDTASGPGELEPPLSRYAAPVRQALPPVRPLAYLRLGILALGALAVLGFLLFGIRALYRATAQIPESADAPAVPQVSETTAKAGADTAAPVKETVRTPQKIPALYID